MIQIRTDHSSLNRLFAGLAFAVAFLLYLSTLPPTASFWDCSERIACAWGLQIPHPPGTPFYLLMGRLFSMFVPATSAAYMINMMSALASSLTIMLLYLIIVRFVREFRGHNIDSYGTIDRIGLYGGALTGALTFAVSDSHWFTSIEAETYALSLTFTALVVWLVLKWSEQHNALRNERWLLLIVFLFGLAFGVHLLSLLAIFFVGLIIYFRKFEFQVASFLIASAITVGIFFLIFPLTIIQLPALAGTFEQLTGGLLGAASFLVLAVAVVAWGIWFTHKRNYRIANIVLLGYMLILTGYSSYSLIYIRSQVNPGIDQNSPDTVDAFISYLKREQYGQQPLVRGASYNNITGSIDHDNPKLFPRRHSSDPRHQQLYARYNSDWDFFINYQVGHMYLRYFAWNFIGRDSDLQDAAWISGFSGDTGFRDNRAHNRFFYLPFLLGLIGMIYHFRRDWKRALAVLVLFTATGLAIVAYLNQTPFQPRERDYSYTGSFFAFSIWIGLGVTGLVALAKHFYAKSIYPFYGILVLALLAGPVLVGSQTRSNNDRSLRYVAPDYAYNLLNSTAPYAILFTNGDNDTFPLWYLQEVEGIRTDVRVVNLSLLNTPWYIKQIKNQWNYDSPPVPIDLTDEEVDRLDEKFRFRRAEDFHEPGDMVIPVDREFLAGVFDGTVDFPWAPREIRDEMGFDVPFESFDDQITWYFEGSYLGTDRDGREIRYTRIQDDMVLEILRTNQWVRPVYFSTTVARDGQMNMQDYFRLEGKAFRVVPFRTGGQLDTRIHGERLNVFRLREVDNERAYFDQNIRRMLDNYRTVYNRQATALLEDGDTDGAVYWLERGETLVPFHTIQGDPVSVLNYAHSYARADRQDHALRLAKLPREEMDRDLRGYLRDLDRIETEIERLEDRLSGSARTLDSQRRRQIQSEISALSRERQQVVREISFDSSRYILLQGLYFMADLEEEALEISSFIDEVSSGRLPFPQDRDENRQQMTRIFGS